MFKTLKKPALLKIYVIPPLTVTAGSMAGAIAVLYALDLGANILQVNLITTIRSAMGIILLVPFGILSDRFGRKPMVLYPTAVMLLGTVIRVFATNPNHLLVAALTGGFAGGGFFPVLLSMVGDIAEPEEQHVAISTLFLFSSIGMLLGPLITSFFLTLPQMTLRNIYQIVAVAQAGALLYMTTQIRETKPRVSEGKKPEYRANISGLIRQSVFLSLLVMVFFYFFYFSIMNTYVPIYARVDLGLSDAEIASFSTYRSLAVMLVRFASASFLVGVPIRPFLVSALALGGVAGIASPFTNGYLSIILVLLVSGLSFGAVRILSSALVAKISTSKNRGLANSLLNVAMSMGNITNIVTSPVADTLGLTPVFLLGGVSTLIATTLAFLRKKW